MAQELLAMVAEVAEEMDGVELYPNYSGRVMFGRTCAGFTLDRDVTPLAFFGQLLEAANDMDAEDREVILSVLPEMMRDARTRWASGPSSTSRASTSRASRANNAEGLRALPL